jgi:RNA polymerase sigma-70 factor (TIGR02943 family)
VAEDVVQDTLLAAIKGLGRFDRRSSEKTWLLSILKRKIADHFREQFREEKFFEDEVRSKDLEEQFDENGWRVPAPRSTKRKFAVDVLERDLFWRMVQECVSGMPTKFAEVFFLRTIEQVSTRELCEWLQISSNHLGVILHRVRSALRLCLEKRWFKREKFE